jgi:hypothetical protein
VDAGQVHLREIRETTRLRPKSGMRLAETALAHNRKRSRTESRRLKRHVRSPADAPAQRLHPIPATAASAAHCSGRQLGPASEEGTGRLRTGHSSAESHDTRNDDISAET